MLVASAGSELWHQLSGLEVAFEEGDSVPVVLASFVGPHSPLVSVLVCTIIM